MNKKWLVASFLLLFVISFVAGCNKSEKIPEGYSPVPAHGELDIQSVIDSEILEEFKKGDYILEDPLVIVDPYEVAPLTALVLFSTGEETRISIEVAGKTEDASTRFDFQEMKKDHQIPVYGLYADYANSVTLTAVDSAGQQEQVSLTIQTEPLHDLAPEVEVLRKDLDKVSSEEWFYTSGAMNTGYISVAYDKYGDIRWMSDIAGYGLGFRKSLENNGRHITFAEHLRGAYYSTGIYEVDWMGKVYTTYLSNGTHHDTILMPNGNYVIANEDVSKNTVEDILTEFDRETGEIVRTWDLEDIYGYDNMEGDWCHVNSIMYDEASNSFLVSCNALAAVTKFDIDTLEIDWVICDPNRPLSETLKAKALTPVGENFIWNGTQHTARFVEDDIIFFDNGSRRLDAEGNDVPFEENFSRAVRFHVDEEQMTISQVWEHGTEYGVETYSSFISSVEFLEPDHYLINFGAIITDGEVFVPGFRQMRQYPGADFRPLVIEILDDEVIFEARLVKSPNPAAYRAIKILPYEPDMTEFNLGEEAKILGELEITDTVDYSPAEESIDLALEDVHIEDNGLVLQVQIGKTPEVEDEEAEVKYYFRLHNDDHDQYYDITTNIIGSLSTSIVREGLEPGMYFMDVIREINESETASYSSNLVWVVK